jgi:hypothetical protein
MWVRRFESVQSEVADDSFLVYMCNFFRQSYVCFCCFDRCSWIFTFAHKTQKRIQHLYIGKIFCMGGRWKLRVQENLLPPYINIQRTVLMKLNRLEADESLQN